ncbi:MAG TPA: HEAT repeat domain-containing protein [Blastocatellia bacterium]|nr:HEAT repeat domain-containing protein [Blastocatellia bacterium]
MPLIILIVVVVVAALWWVNSQRTQSANERLYLKRRGYAGGEYLETGPPVPKDSRLFSLIESLADISPFARQRAAEELSRLFASGQRDPLVLASLIAALKDSDAAVRSAVATALGNLGDVAAVEPLRRRLEDEDSINVRASVKRAIGKLEGGPR